MIISQHCGLPFVGAPRFLAVLREKKNKAQMYRGSFRYYLARVYQIFNCDDWGS